MSLLSIFHFSQSVNHCALVAEPLQG